MKDRVTTVSESLGQTLAKRRRSLGKTLHEAEVQTKIRARLLEALENGSYDILPSPAYVRGYVIAYAKFLGLDAGDLLAAYDRESGHTPTPPRVPVNPVPPRGHGQQFPVKTALIALFILLIAGGVVWGATRVLRGPEPPPPIPAADEQPADAQPSAESTPLPDVAPNPTDEQAAVSTPFTLTLVVAPQSASWLRVTVDGLVAYEGTLTGARTMEWEVAEEASVRIGRPASVTVLRDGAPVPIPPGDPPTVVLAISD